MNIHKSQLFWCSPRGQGFDPSPFPYFFILLDMDVLLLILVKPRRHRWRNQWTRSETKKPNRVSTLSTTGWKYPCLSVISTFSTGSPNVSDMYCIQMDFDFENHITLWSIRSRFYHWTTGFPIPSPVSMTPAKERVGHRRAGSHPTLLEQLLWEHRCSWDSWGSELWCPPEIKLGTSQKAFPWWPFSSFVVDKSGHFRCKDFHRLPVTQENWGHWHHFSCFSHMFPTFSPKNPPIPSHPQPSPSHGPAAVGTAEPGLRGGLLGHATPGGELAGAEATAGGGEVGRSPAALENPWMLMLGDDKVMEMDGNGYNYIYVCIYIYICNIIYTILYNIGFCWVSCLAFAGR